MSKLTENFCTMNVNKKIFLKKIRESSFDRDGIKDLFKSLKDNCFKIMKKLSKIKGE